MKLPICVAMEAHIGFPAGETPVYFKGLHTVWLKILGINLNDEDNARYPDPEDFHAHV